MRKTIIAMLILLPVISVMAETIAPDSSRVYKLDEVVITPNKEFYQLRQQPISSTSFTAEALEPLNLQDLREISDYVPSFVMPNYGSRFTSSIYVRGIGSRVNSPSMGVYVDGMPLISKTAFNSHIYQVDHVDVLRGPQGTLYGQNTEGGLIRITTRNPLNYQGTDVHLGIGLHFYRNVEAAHYQRVNDKLGFSVAGFYNGTNGFRKNSTTGERADDSNEAGGRFHLVFEPTHRLSFDFVADYQYVNQKAYPYGLLNPENGEVLGEPNQDSQSKYKRHMFNTGLGIKYEANGFDIFSNTSYQYLKDNLLMDNDYSDIDFIVVDQSQLQNAITEELSFKSNNDSRWHWNTGVFGSYTWLKTVAPNQFGTAFSQMMNTQIGGMIQQQMLKSMIARGMTEEAAMATIQRAGGVSIGMSLFVPCNFHTPQFNLGIFHESNIDITNNLVATLGLRYDFTQSKIDYYTAGDSKIDFNIMGLKAAASVLSVFEHEHTANFSQLLPKFGLTYKFGEGSNVYATVTKGYRSGGFNVQMFGDIINSDVQKSLQTVLGEAQTTRADVSKVITHSEEEYDTLLEGVKFKPEESWNYDFGTHLNLLDNRLHADLSLFYMQIRNQQLSVFTEDYGYGRKMVNAGKSYSCGLEAAVRGIALDDHLTWSLSYGYTHAAFKEYVSKESSRGAAVDYEGKRVPFIPEHTGAATADYRFDLSGSTLRSLTLGANVTAQGNIYWDEANSFEQKLYAVAGAHLLADLGMMKVNLWARNLTDTKYNTFAFLSKATGAAVYSAQLGNPFQFGVDVSFHF